MEYKQLNLEFIQQDFDVKSRDLDKRHPIEKGELLADLRNRGLASSGGGYQQIRGLLTNQIEERVNLYIEAVFESIHTNVQINETLQSEMCKAVEVFIDRSIQQELMSFQQIVARDKIDKNYDKEQYRILDSETHDLKVHLRKKMDTEIRRWNHRIKGEALNPRISTSQRKVNQRKKIFETAFNTYSTISEIGRGGSRIVYEVTDDKLVINSH